jgi:hypothetical protein
MSEDNKDLVLIENNSVESQLARAYDLLPIHEYNVLKKYIEDGKHQLSPDTVTRFFELFLNGSDCREIHRLNKVFPYEAIVWARIKYRWDDQKDLYITSLQSNVRDKVVKAQLETTSLVTDLLVATNKRYGDKLKRYIQSGDEKELQGALSVDNVNGLLKLAEGLLKVTGQDRTTIQKSETKQTTEININGKAQNESPISSEAAAKILSIIAEEKRKQDKNK